jgi:hypothetical protein
MRLHIDRFIRRRRKLADGKKALKKDENLKIRKRCMLALSN